MNRGENTVNKLLGNGIYSLAEVGRYTGVHPSTVRAWFRDGSVFHSDYPRVNGDLAVSFYDLIDVLVAGQLRAKGASLHQVRAAYEQLKIDFDTSHPFCRQDLAVHNGRVFCSGATKAGYPDLYQVVGGQKFFHNFMERYMKNIDYNALTKLAESWRIAHGVVIEPNLALGSPVIAGTGTMTRVLYRAWKSNDQDASTVAEMYDVTKSQVIAAVKFETKKFDRRIAA